jgi:hypothetical protein
MAWIMRKRNQLITGGDISAHCRTAAFHLKDALTTAGWTVVGSGTGTAGAFNWGGADLWAAAPTLDMCWVALQNLDGVQLLLQCSTSTLLMYWYKGVYSGVGAAANVLPNRAPNLPASEVANSLGGGWTSGTPYANASDFYLQVAVDDVTLSFWAWAKNAAIVTYGTALVKLTDAKASDPNPYWGVRYGTGGTSAFSLNCMCTILDHTYSVHPATNVRTEYGLTELLGLGVDSMFTAIPVDPNSANEQLMECLVGSVISNYWHLKGKAPGILRCSSSRSVGDTFDAETYVCVGVYALPWSAGAAML